MDPKDCGGFGNQVLYQMCRDYPGHTDTDVISGKMWLIGRAYSVSIERRAGDTLREAKNEHKSLYELIAPKIASSGLDKWLDLVADVRHVNLDNLPHVLAAHLRFVRLLKTLTGLERRSFASKYLHFHQPWAFFIYDSRAQSEIRRKVHQCSLKLPAHCTEYDGAYANFVLRCIQYRDEKASKSGGPPMTPRKLDRELLGY